ncbi:MAG TPA: DUF1566 domain-containing protein [Candidatus Binatia bacterium]|jgi:hypothetical protein
MTQFTTVRRVTLFLGSLLLLLPALPAAAGLSPDVRCETGKLKTTASYASCRLKADALGLVKSLSPDYSNCVSKIDSKFPKLEEQAGAGVCPSNNDLGDIRARTDDYEQTIATLLAGGTIPSAQCGNGTLESGEQCDVGQLSGQTCQSEGFPGGGNLRCGPGCTFDTSDCHATQFEDTGLTVVDHINGLEWEKKDGSDGSASNTDVHDVDNTYTWAASGASTNTTMTGTMYTVFLTALNGVTDTMTTTTSGCYANHCDWRIPTIDELKSITKLSPGCSSAPCVLDAAFLPNRSGRYWSNSTRAGSPTGAHFVEFLTGQVSNDLKTTAYSARAVRSIE